MSALTIDLETARRFVLGRQGLWPGRRWHGEDGTGQAMTAMEYLQLDPLNMVARSHDIALYSRVTGYTPGGWEALAYQQRKFFDWGGWLAVRPMCELPYWRVVMQTERDHHPGVLQIAAAHADAIEEMRSILRERETVSNREFKSGARTRTQNYRGGKDSSLALYYLWRTGEVMTHHRTNFERVYALTERVAPLEYQYESNLEEVERFLILKEIGFSGLIHLKHDLFASQMGGRQPKTRGAFEKLLVDGGIIEVKVEGWKNIQYILQSDYSILMELSAGRIPDTWAPVDTTTREEAVFLAPLDPVSARGRAKMLFGFDYVWEVYKPEHKRRFGYYTLPVLWGDRLVARFDSKMDRTTNTLVLLGLWLEDEVLGMDETFALALSRGFKRFITFLGAIRINVDVIKEPLLRSLVGSVMDPWTE